jgi:hypothetical protein
MYVTKTKSYNQIPLSTLKEHLNIGQDDNSRDSEILRLSKTATQIAEKFIQGDIGTTQSLLEDYDFSGCYYDILEPNISVIGVTGSTVVTGYSVQKFSNYTRIKFSTSVNATTLSIRFTSGYAAIPFDVQQAILLKVGELFDVDKQNVLPSNIKPSKAFERTLTPYINLLY